MTIRRPIFLNLVLANVALGQFIVSLLNAQSAQLTLQKEFVIQNWDTEEGLPVSTVTSVAKTPDGFLWIGTPNGLVRYDGYRFRTFHAGNTPALCDPHITSLLVDRTGSLWVGTHNGSLVKVVRGIFTNIIRSGSVYAAQVNGLVQDLKGTIWGTFDRAGVFRYENGKLTLYGTNHGLPWQIVWGITSDAKGDLWVISRGQLMRFNNERWEKPPELAVDLPRISTVTPARDGGLWIACVAKAGPPTGDRGTRIFKLTGGEIVEDNQPVPWNQDSRRSIARLLLEDQQGRLWCATRGAGIFIRDKTGWRLLSEPSTLCQVQAISITEDVDGNIWVGMDGAGLFRFGPKLVFGLEPLPGSPSSCFWTVYVGRDGSIWGGTDGNGIYRWKNGEVTRFGRADGLLNEHINAIIQDSKGRVWAGTMGGLYMFNHTQFERVTGVSALELPVYALKEDRVGHIWVGTRNGLVQLSAGATNVFDTQHGVPTGAINAIEEDLHGRIWISIPPTRDPRAPGTLEPHGLFIKNGDNFERVGEGQWPGEKSIRCLHADTFGNLWIGTVGAGLFLYRNGKFTEISSEDGLPNDRIQAIVPDNAGNLWFCSEAGIFGAPLERLLAYNPSRRVPLNWWRVRRSDGLPNSAATGNGFPSAVLAPDGSIWFANGNAIASFKPSSVIQATRIWPPLIDAVIVNGLHQLTEPSKLLKVGPGVRRVEIHYTSPNVIAPDIPAFWIRLNGFDADWVHAGDQRVVTYNLQPGLYQFEVATVGPDGTRLETTIPLALEVIPTFWERIQVRLLAGLVVVLGVAASVWHLERARSRRRVRELELQRAMDDVRQRIARDLHDDLGSGLTEIALLCDNLRADSNDTAVVKKTVERIAERARALTHQMDEVVWAVNPQTDTLEALVTYLNEYAQEILTMAGIRCRLNTAPELPNLKLPTHIRHSLFRAAKEALNNAVKHGKPTEVTITIEPEGDKLVFLIQDNGLGFDPNQKLTHGNGLKNIQQRIEEIGGTCIIRSAIGNGTTVCFSIPISNNNDQHIINNLV